MFGRLNGEDLKEQVLMIPSISSVFGTEKGAESVEIDKQDDQSKCEGDRL